MNRWELTEEVKEKYTPIIREFIRKLESNNPKDEEKRLEMDLSGTELNPFTLEKLLENLGYEQTEQDNNGWQFDFWITMQKDECKDLSIKGTGITFELKLSEKE